MKHSGQRNKIIFVSLDIAQNAEEELRYRTANDSSVCRIKNGWGK